MRVFDASSMIYAWDNYPIGQFPGLWKWMATQINQKKLLMPKVSFKEVADKTPDCEEWLKDNRLELLEISNAILQDARRIKALLGITDDNFHAKGVGENDLLIIATARAYKMELVSNEATQNILPKVPAKRRIPSVCLMHEVSVSCIDFIEYIKLSNAIFN